LAAYQKIDSLAKRLVGPVDLITDEVLDENLNNVMTTVSE
jgi:hypothetical protein